ncbi:ABC transporter substrate-binding protein [Robbsia andropogonis]|uniref:ABC transporter substrate-binding protein n=1 Tax=Robbsia andropogonis TaxID=28092 RepID=A0A0F5JY94_9BURK|nr:ABC transporter substrate-binding protein [Robbsia andropogonis]KKB62856.1 ABC transporter substrate-binding protein [Robbsia andropogonis]MCP1118129.1 ABC transporter substrate-binding protein [Robbsia andropogonis]MCP1127590.1 ABC transporter substrate-binding protein [Robbsia andropogonis]
MNNDDVKRVDSGRRDMMRHLLGAAVLVGGGGTSYLVQAATTPTARRGGSIRAAYDSSSTADTLDPAKGSAGGDYIRAYMFYSGLTQLDSALAPTMNLAESIVSSDAKVWTITLRKGVTFHDGKSLTTADVIYSLLRHKDPKVASKIMTLAEQFTDAKAIGPNQIELTLANANADLPVLLADSHLVIVKDQTTDFSTAIGTGPYKLKTFQPGVLTAGIRNEQYFKPGLPHLDQVELVGIADGAARVNALLAGDVQLVNAVNPRSTKQVSSASGFAIMETKSGLYSDLIMRVDDPLTGNRDFVQGMKYLFDRTQIRDAVFGGYAVVGNDQPLPPMHRYYNAEVKPLPFDLDKAKFHFKNAGVLGKSTPPVFATTAANGSQEMAVFLQQAAARVGVQIPINRVPADGYWSNYWMRRPLSFGNINPRPSADVLFSQFFASKAPWNESGWNNPKFDQLLLAARAETDEAKRKQMYGDMQQIISTEGSIGIPAFVSFLDGYDKRIQGLKSIPTGPMMGFNFAEYVWWNA